MSVNIKQFTVFASSALILQHYYHVSQLGFFNVEQEEIER